MDAVMQTQTAFEKGIENFAKLYDKHNNDISNGLASTFEKDIKFNELVIGKDATTLTAATAATAYAAALIENMTNDNACNINQSLTNLVQKVIAIAQLTSKNLNSGSFFRLLSGIEAKFNEKIRGVTNNPPITNCKSLNMLSVLQNINANNPYERPERCGGFLYNACTRDYRAPTCSFNSYRSRSRSRSRSGRQRTRSGSRTR